MTFYEHYYRSFSFQKRVIVAYEHHYRPLYLKINKINKKGHKSFFIYFYFIIIIIIFFLAFIQSSKILSVELTKTHNFGFIHYIKYPCMHYILDNVQHVLLHPMLPFLFGTRLHTQQHLLHPILPFLFGTQQHTHTTTTT